MKKPSEMKVGERMIDFMPDNEIKKMSEHICFVKMCDRNHFCSSNFGHRGGHVSLTHIAVCLGEKLEVNKE